MLERLKFYVSALVGVIIKVKLHRINIDIFYLKNSCLLIENIPSFGRRVFCFKA